jgi:hypothetical protein
MGYSESVANPPRADGALPAPAFRQNQTGFSAESGLDYFLPNDAPGGNPGTHVRGG